MKISLDNSSVQRSRPKARQPEVSSTEESTTENRASLQQNSWIVWSEILLSWVVLLALLYYTSLELVRAPYLGFHFDGATGEVTDLFVIQREVDLQVGDRFVAVSGDIADTCSSKYIGAELTLESAPGEGTRVRVVWVGGREQK